MTAIGPTANHWLRHSRNVTFIYNEVRAVEERGHSTAQEYRTNNAVDDEERLEGANAQEIAQLVLKFVANGLNNKREEYNHPKPIGTAKAGTIKQRERCKEATTKYHQRSKGKFPLSASGINHQPAFVLGLTKGKYKGVCALNKHQEHQQCA